MRTFELANTVSTTLWDFGWFDRSSFRIVGADPGLPAVLILQDFLSSSVFPRSFCELPNPWGASIDRHGPILVNNLSAEIYQRASHNELREEAHAILEDRRFDKSPSEVQQLPVAAWLDSVQMATSFALRRDPGREVDWNHVWFLFREFVSFDPGAMLMTVAVFGYD